MTCRFGKKRNGKGKGKYMNKVKIMSIKQSKIRG